MYKTALIFGAFFAGLGIILGAFGAHALKEILAEGQIQVYETAVRYQMYHAFALLIVGLLYHHCPFRALKWAAALFIIGIVLFSGSLYAMTALRINGQVGLGGLGIITPVGGLFFIAGWLITMIAVLKKR